MYKFKIAFLKTVFLGVLLMTLSCIDSYGQTKIDKIDKLVNSFNENGYFNGSVLVAEKGKVIYKKGFGFANMELNVPNQSDTKFRLGSVTKQFTAMLIMQLVQQGLLKLDVPISTYLPDYPKSNGDIITIHHLLTHTSGTPNYTNFPGFRKMMSQQYQPEEIVNVFADSALEFKPGDRFEYSNSGYILLGVIIEKVTGKSFEQVLKENILTPLNMKNTGYDHSSTLLKNRASGYEKNGRSYVNASYLDMSLPFAAGAMYSTVEDLFLWNQALYTEKLLPKKYLDLIFTKQISARGDYYGYGWFIGKMIIGNTHEKEQTVFHGGSVNGFNTLITRIPADSSFIVLLNNTSGAPLEEMNSAIGGILYDKPYDFPKKALAYALSDVIEKDGIPAAHEFYNKFKDSGDYRLIESEMNDVGYYFLQSNRVNEAVFVLKLNTEEYPESFNAYDSYGEALLASGKKTEAIDSYKKSVELNPGSASGIKALKGLGAYSNTFIKNISLDRLKLLEGKYTSADDNSAIEFRIINGELTGNDNGYRYRLIPVADNEFVNPDDGAKLIFDTKDKNSTTVLLFGKLRYKMK